MRAEMLQERIIGCNFSDRMLENSGYDYDTQYTWRADSFATARDVFLYCQDRYISPEGRTLLERYINQCVIMNTISALMHCGMVGLLKTYLLARPPIEGFLSAMIAFAVQKGADWTAEILEAYRRGDMDFIRTYPETDIAPMELKLQMPERPEDLAENYAPTVLRAAERLKHERRQRDSQILCTEQPSGHRQRGGVRSDADGAGVAQEPEGQLQRKELLRFPHRLRRLRLLLWNWQASAGRSMHVSLFSHHGQSIIPILYIICRTTFLQIAFTEKCRRNAAQAERIRRSFIGCPRE